MDQDDIADGTGSAAQPHRRKLDDLEGFVSVEGGDAVGYVTYVYGREHHPVSALGGVERFPLLPHSAFVPDANVKEPGLYQD